MKEIQPPLSIMEKMVDRLQEYYPNHNVRSNGIIQFHFTHENTRVDCYIKSDENMLQLQKGIAENPTVTVNHLFTIGSD